MDLLQHEVPAAFEELVRDALLHLYDPGHLHGHALLRYASAAPVGAVPPARALRQALLDAIDALRPGTGVPAASRAWRIYHILEVRYIEGQEVVVVSDQMALSKSQYHREHQRALQAVASVLWEKWGLTDSSCSQPRAGLAATTPDQLARSEAQRLSQDRSVQSIDVAEVARGVARLVEPLAQRRGVELRVSVPAALPALRGDRVALRHALLTLLTPALHRLTGGMLEIRAYGGYQQVAIDLLSPAEQGKVPAADLAESRLFVEALGGQLALLPPRAASPAWRITLHFPTDDRPALLVVDNNADFLRLIERYLAGQAWQMVGATDADIALSIATRHRPAAILLDVVIPGRDGWELLQDLKTAPETHDIPVAVCSVLHEPDVAKALGAAAYFRKPLDQRQLLEWLGSLAATWGKGAGDVPGAPSPVR
jgi:CheY-like chemotaxis protein